MKNILIFLLITISSEVAIPAGIGGASTFKFSLPKNIVSKKLGYSAYIANLKKFEEGECRFNIYQDNDFKVEVRDGKPYIKSEPILGNIRAFCFFDAVGQKRRRVETNILDGDLVALYFRQPNFEKNVDEVLISIFSIEGINGVTLSPNGKSEKGDGGN